MNGKKRWRVDVDVPAGEGMGFVVVSYEGIMSTSEDGAKKQIRSRLRKRGLKPYSANKRPVRAYRMYTSLEKLQNAATKILHNVKDHHRHYDIVHIIRRSQDKESMRKQIMKQIGAYQKPLTQLREAFVTFFYEESELGNQLVTKSQDFGTTIQNLVRECINDEEDWEEVMTLLTARLESLADQCYEMIEQI